MPDKANDPLDNEKTLKIQTEDSLGDMPTMKLDQSGIGRVDRYELLEKLGEGGFGAVYGAKDTEAGILVALKALPSEVSCDADEMASIRDNFALVSKLHHPNIASLLHLHRVERADGRAAAALGVRAGDYLTVMEYAPGATLFAFRRAMPGQKLDFFQALEIARPIADALDFAHSQRVLHRDVKPKNIMLAHDSRFGIRDTSKTNPASCISHPASTQVKVLDFGLAAEIRSSMSRKSKEPQNSKSGTPLYMAPEQWEGKRQDGRADQYALAALVYELVSGEVPFKSAFDSGNFEIMRNVVLGTKVEPINGLTKKQNAVLLRALSKNPEERFGSCGEFVDALAGGKIYSPRKSAKNAKNKSAIGNRKSKMLVGVCALAVIAAAYVSYTSYRSHASQKQQAAAQSAETQAQVSSLMREAQTAFAAGDLDSATEKAQAVLKLADNHPEATALLLEVEKKAGERRTREVKIDAELAVEKLERDITDRGQGFAEKFEALKKELLIAQDAYASRSWGQAFTAFKKVMADGEALRALDDDRKDAKTQRSQMESSRRGAQSAKADELAKKEWEQAVGGARSATQFFEKGKFEEASKGWKNAAEIFQGSEEIANAISLYREAKANWEQAISNPESRIPNQQLRQYAETAFGDAEKAARLGAECENEPLRGKQHYETAIAKYAEAVKTAEPFLVPQLSVECNVSGADIQLGRDGSPSRPAARSESTPYQLEKNQTYTLTVSKKGYKTNTEKLTADWTGLRTKSVVLEEWNGPEEGKKWTADLGSGVEMDFMPIAAGSFQMGSNNGDSDEKPVHRVTLTQPFWMAKTEVTQAQYKQIMGSNPSRFQGLENPVETVSWNDALEFCRKLTALERKAGRLPEGFEYTLPTEAQWEYACRAGTTGDYAGNLDSMAWYTSNSGSTTHPVGQKQANAWGLYDMHGNVWEWCLDDWHGSYSGAPSDGSRWGDGSGSYRVIRGGGWNSSASGCRSAIRYFSSPDGTHGDLGFRPLVLQK